MYGLPRSLLLLSAALLAKAQTLDVEFPENPPDNATSNVVKDNFLGISWELSSLDTLWGTTVDTMPHAIQNYLANIKARFQSPLRIRIGGNGMDGSIYVPDKTDAMLTLTDPDAYFNDIPVDFGPILFDVLNKMYDNVGEMQFMIGLSMRDPDNKENAVAVARDAESKLGSRLDSLLLGNEPDLYAGHEEREVYNISMYIPEVSDMIDELEEEGLLNRPLLGGPTICCPWSLEDVLDAGLADFDQYNYYTLQHYPNHACQGENEQNTNISYYLTHTNLDGYVNWNTDGIDLAHSEGVPVVLTEYNSVACGGSRISNTFATSLWAVDVAMKSAAHNFSAVYLHTREHDVQYNLFEPRVAGQSLTNDWKTGSTYYSALFMSEVFSPNGSVVVDLNLNQSNTNVEATIASFGVWDVQEGGGFSRSKLVFINYNEAEEPQSFRIPSSLTSRVDYRILTAPSVWSNADNGTITWAGQWVGMNGQLEGAQEADSIDCDEQDGCVLEIPSPGAALVILEGGGSFYVGNSTVVGYITGEDAEDEQDAATAGMPVQWLVWMLAMAGGVLLF